MEYTVVMHPAEEGGYWAEIPALPGCYSQGETLDEVMENVKEAVESHIDALKQDNQVVPVERGLMIGKVEVLAA
ncbi:MAG: type II toxin-antitoxin system HicB family antitoxin [Deltaproteobacteria bacterium]|nr:type II toxin-antitoxin system HicB family antitoxin [Deltaproteobacteria bacterium]MBW1793212.1 type II toxin-antitoxin system HicB family antitoxin [Deltaproteobacteria bacterium]